MWQMRELEVLKKRFKLIELNAVRQGKANHIPSNTRMPYFI